MSSIPTAPQRPLRVAMIGTRGLPASYGGVERAVEELSARLVARGHDVTVYGRRGYCDDRATAYRGIRQIVMGYVGAKHFEAASHTAVAVAHALAVRRFDVVHFHATGPALFAPLPRLAGTAVVATVQGLDWRREKWGPAARITLRVAARVSASAPDQTIVVSRSLRQHLRDVYQAESHYVPNGVDTRGLVEQRPVPGLQPDRFVLFLGRLVPEKQIHVLIEAFKAVDTDHRLALAGPSSNTDAYVRRLEALAAGDERIMLLGPRYGAEKGWLMRNASLFVQPSTVEGLPIALLEAMACGRYPVVSDIPENIEAATVGGRLMARSFRTGDLEHLRDVISESLADPARRVVAAEAAALVSETYDWNRIAAETERIYAAATRKAPRPPLGSGRS